MGVRACLGVNADQTEVRVRHGIRVKSIFFVRVRVRLVRV